MRRREFITLLGGAAAWMSPARAQEPRRVIGVLGSASFSSFPGAEAAFIQGLKNSGFIEGKNINIEWRWGEGQYNRMSSLAGELVARNVSVISAFDLPSALAAKAATNTIPIVFATGADPVKLGLVDSLNRPRGNLTASESLDFSISDKCQQRLVIRVVDKNVFQAVAIGVFQHGSQRCHACRTVKLRIGELRRTVVSHLRQKSR